MRLLDIRGRSVCKNVSRYSIDWDGKSRSIIQADIKRFLKPYWYGQIVYEEFPVYGSLLKVDILNATRRIAVEVNGKQHGQYNKFFHNNDHANFLKSIKRDVQKRDWLERNGFVLVEVEFNEVSSISKEFFEKNYGVHL